MGKRVYGIRSFAYRIPHPHAAAASRLRLPRIWNPSFRENYSSDGSTVSGSAYCERPTLKVTTTFSRIY